MNNIQIAKKLCPQCQKMKKESSFYGRKKSKTSDKIWEWKINICSTCARNNSRHKARSNNSVIHITQRDFNHISTEYDDNEDEDEDNYIYPSHTECEENDFHDQTCRADNHHYLQLGVSRSIYCQKCGHSLDL